MITCAIGTANVQTTVKERAATEPATARDDQTSDNMIRHKNSSIHVAFRSFYSKLFTLNISHDNFTGADQ